MSIEWARPGFLMLGLAIPLWVWWTRPTSGWGMLVARGDEASDVAMSRWMSTTLEWIPRLLRATSLAALILALADPRLVSTYEETIDERAAIAVAIDLSTSMWAQDMAAGTTRLQAAKSAARGFLDRLTVGQVGLVTFAGESHVRLPLTADRYVAAAAVDGLDVGLLLDGTDVAGAIAAGADLLRRAPERERILILVTDGAHNRAGLEPALAARAAAAFGVRVYPIAIGTDEALSASLTGMETVLTQTAEITGGRYFRAVDARALGEIYTELERLSTGGTATVTRTEVTPLGHWFLLACLIAWLAAGALRASRWGVVP